MAKQDPPAGIGHQEGSRWINRRPTGEEVAEWFAANVKIHEGLDPADYVGGIVLIGGTEKMKVAKQAQGGSLQIVEEERLAYTPYAKVETRVKYFWDLMALKSDEWVGVIEPVQMAQLEEPGLVNRNLPPGFYRVPVRKPDDSFVHYVGCSMRVVIYKAGTVEWKPRGVWPSGSGVWSGGGSPPDPTERELQVARHLREEVLRGIPVAIYPPATKMVSTLTQFGKDDPFSLMKAETGAVGRALGMAGMLVIPGSGIATAEDMHEAQAGASGVGVGEQATLDAPLPPQVEEVDVRDQIKEKLVTLQSTNTEGYERVAAWAKERKLDLDNPKETQLRGLLLQLQRALGES